MTSISSEEALKGVPAGLRVPLLEEFNKLVKHYRESRWEPAELNGGKLCEIVHTILRGFVDGSFAAAPSKPSNMVDACNGLAKALNFPRSVRIQIPRMLIALYEIRNNRNVGHVGADVDPSHMDATVVYGMAKWIMSELVRIFHSVTPEQATAIVEALTDREVPLLWQIGDRIRVLNSGMTARNKTLVVLYGSAGPQPAKRLAETIEYANVSQFRQKVLKPAHKADLVHFEAKNDMVSISPVGVRFVEREIPLMV